jgi:hypothetical protein
MKTAQQLTDQEKEQLKNIVEQRVVSDDYFSLNNSQKSDWQRRICTDPDVMAACGDSVDPVYVKNAIINPLGKSNREVKYEDICEALSLSDEQRSSLDIEFETPPNQELVWIRAGSRSGLLLGVLGIATTETWGQAIIRLGLGGYLSSVDIPLRGVILSARHRLLSDDELNIIRREIKALGLTPLVVHPTQEKVQITRLLLPSSFSIAGFSELMTDHGYEFN